MKEKILFLSFITVGFLSIMCKPDTLSNKKESYSKDVSTTLKASSPFPIGASVNVHLLQKDSLYRKTIATEFNSVTPENAMKWEAIHPEIDTYDFSAADALVDFATTHKIRIHGHNLAWYQSNPKWLEEFQGDKQQWEEILHKHIATIVSRYRKKISSWDVINEEFDEYGNRREKNIWDKNIGSSYINEAFQFAHEADPDALLFYNDYGQDESEKKTSAILNLIYHLKADHVPIHGIGIQMHINLKSNNASIKKVIQQFAATGLLIHISELDIAINGEKGDLSKVTSSLLSQQAAKYKFIVDTYLSYVPAKQKYGITTWDVGDKDSWLRKQYHHLDWPLLFDDNYNKKDAYFAFLDALKTTIKQKNKTL